MEQLNNNIKALPFVWHLIASAIVIVMLSHVWIGFLKTRNRLSPHIRRFLWVSLLVMTFYFCNRYSQPENILDLYYFRWWIFYFQAIIILKGRVLQTCKTFHDLWSNIFRFDTYKQ